MWKVIYMITEDKTSSVTEDNTTSLCGRRSENPNITKYKYKEPRRTQYLLHVKRVCVFGAKLGQLRWGQGLRRFLWGWVEVFVLFLFHHLVSLYITLTGWLKVSWCCLMVSIGCWSSAALFRADGRLDVRAQSDQNSPDKINSHVLAKSSTQTGNSMEWVVNITWRSWQDQ